MLITEHNKRGGKRLNAGRPSKEATETINFRIPISDKVKLKELPISKLFKEWYQYLLTPTNKS